MKKRNVLIGEREQLPNIYGTFGRFYGEYNNQKSSGAFSNYWATNYTSKHNSSSWNNNTGYQFNAIKGQVTENGTILPVEMSTYKNGGIVRPSNTIIRIWKRVN